MCIHCGIGKWFAWKPEVTQLSHPSRGLWGGRIPIVIKVPLLFHVPSFALNKGQFCRQSGTDRMWCVKRLCFSFMRSAFITLQSTHQQTINLAYWKQAYQSWGITCQRWPRALLDMSLSLESQGAEPQLHLALGRHMIGATWHFAPRKTIRSCFAWYLWVLYHGLALFKTYCRRIQILWMQPNITHKNIF